MQTEKHLLLLNLPISVRISSDQHIYIKTPSIEDYESFIGYSFLAAVFGADIEETSKHAGETGFVATNYSDLLIGFAIKIRQGNADQTEMSVVETMKQLCGVDVKANGLFSGSVEISEEVLLEIRHIYLLSLNRVKVGDDDEEQVERNAKISAAQAKIDRIRKRNTDVSGSGTTAWTDVIVSIIYYMGLSVKEIKELNYFGLSEFYNYAIKAQGERINSIAAGNGHTKEYKNITDR